MTKPATTADKLSSDGALRSRLLPKNQSLRAQLHERLAASPIPREERPDNLALYMDSRSLGRLLFLDELYRRILPVHGSILEMGVRFGHNLAAFSCLRTLHEPFNHNRKIIGFDTFEGFPDVDGARDAAARPGEWSVPAGYERHLEETLALHEAMAPTETIRKFELVKGDARKTVPEWLEQHGEAMIALAYFDFDLYEPTRDCLRAILPRLTRGAVIAFDELNDPNWPGESQALREVLPEGRFRLIHSPLRTAAAYTLYDWNP